ncbi:MAG: TonB family protein [Candidatus Gastranaerophilales bacterium]|nr:TonB family protein [Candidatus Gastranaerophilales bacterium]
MKKICFILCFLLFGQNVQASLNWLRINPSPDNSVASFIDITSIKRTDKYVYYLSRIDIESRKDSMVCWIKSDCKNNKNVLLECKDFDKNSIEYFDYAKDSSDLVSFSPDSLIYDLHNSVCYSEPKNVKQTPMTDGIHKIYSKDGHLLSKLTYINGKLNGVATNYYPNGKIEQEAYFKDNIQEGLTRIYYKSGKLKQENNFKDGKADGLGISYYENGKIRSKTPWKDDKENGIAYFYFKNDKIEWAIPYKNGKEEGVVVQYYKNGKIRQLTPYKNGVKDGYLTIYDDKGETVKVTHYKDGVIVGQRESVLGNISKNVVDYGINWKDYYIKDLEELIKSNWHPQKSDTSKSVEILFEIDKNGNIEYKKVINPSGDDNFDKNAISAIKSTGKYKPIPSECKSNSVPVEFTFAYNVESSIQDKSDVIQEAVLLLKKCDFSEPYNIISGGNPTKKEYIIEFKNLEDLDNKYGNFDAIGWKKDGRLYVFINQKHKNSSPEALAAIIAGRSVHIDKFDSINEEAYAWLIEGYIWKALSQNSFQKDDELVKREKAITELIESDLYEGRVLIEFIEKNSGYINYPKQSKGYKDKEFSKKYNKLRNMYLMLNLNQ